MMATAFANNPAVAKKKDPLRYEDDEVRMRLVLRTPAQLAAFYLGREFKQAAVDKILVTCFVTPIIKNKAFDTLWLALDNWRFQAGNEPIERIKRSYWQPVWKEIALPQSHQSTFGWTLMPEIRDLRLDESVGGSVVIPMQSKPFTLIANFATAKDKHGKKKTIVFKGITCKKDTK